MCHEDYPNPLPYAPVITSEQVQQLVEKTKHDLQNWRAKELGLEEICGIKY